MTSSGGGWLAGGVPRGVCVDGKQAATGAGGGGGEGSCLRARTKRQGEGKTPAVPRRLLGVPLLRLS